MTQAGTKKALERWESLKRNIESATPVNRNESASDKAKRIKNLQGNFAEFAAYYFPNYASAPFARFHIRFVNRVIRQDRIFDVEAWARDHGKSVVLMMILVYLAVIKQIRNVLYVSKSYDDAVRLLRPLRAQLESNKRLAYDYGELRHPSNWEEGEFQTKGGVFFRALGKLQSPRVARQDEVRPDMIVCDDIDDDVSVRNPATLDKEWEWMMGALYGTFSVAGAKRFVIINNIIGRDTLTLRAGRKADHFEIVNIYDKKGRPSWKERYTQRDCAYMIDKMGYLANREYFNDPVVVGKVFRNEFFTWGKMNRLADYGHLIVPYLDPGFSSGIHADHKGLVLLGLLGGKYHVLKVFCGAGSVDEMIEWCYAMYEWMSERKNPHTLYMEEVFLQKLLYRDFNDKAQSKGYPVPVSGDKRQKPSKDVRIASLQGDFERGNVLFNEDERENPHMQRLIEQFKMFQVGVKTKKDGPDAFEGAKYLLDMQVKTAVKPIIGRRSRGQSKKHF